MGQLKTDLNRPDAQHLESEIACQIRVEVMSIYLLHYDLKLQSFHPHEFANGELPDLVLGHHPRIGT